MAGAAARATAMIDTLRHAQAMGQAGIARELDRMAAAIAGDG